MKGKIYLSLLAIFSLFLFSCTKEIIKEVEKEVKVYDQLTVVSVTPADNAINVGVGANIEVFFSREINPASATQTSVVVETTAGKVAGLVTCDAKDHISFTPTVPFLNNTAYSVTVKGIATKDSSVIAVKKFGFTTGKLALKAMPMSPMSSEVDVRVDAPIVVGFSGKLKANTISKLSIHLCSTFGIVECIASYDGDAKVTFIPKTELKNDVVYDVVVSGIESLDGVVMDDLKYSFTTEKPTFRIVSCEPAHGTNNVPLDSRIVDIKFNKPVDHSTTIMGQTITVNGGTKTWVVNPPVNREHAYLFPNSMTLEANTVYTITLDGVKSTDGLVLPRTVIVFSTGTMK